MATILYVLLKNGEVKIQTPGKTMPDGTVRMQQGTKWVPAVNGDACRAAGVDPVTVAKNEAPAEYLCRMGQNDHGIEILTSTDYQARKDSALDAAIPGASKALELSRAAANEADRYRHQFNRMMEDEYNDGARPPKRENMAHAEALAAHLAAHPSAAIYLQAVRNQESTSWADNTGKAAAARKAIEILMAGGSAEEAATALAARREVVD